MYFLTHLKGEARESVKLATHRTSKAFALPVLVAVGERSVAEIDQFLYLHFQPNLYYETSNLIKSRVVR